MWPVRSQRKPHGVCDWSARTGTAHGRAGGSNRNWAPPAAKRKPPRLEREEGIDLHRPDPAMERKQAGRLERTRAARDAGAVEGALTELKSAAAGGENLMPRFVDAARARASEGEMVAALQEVFGRYTEQPVF